MQSAAEVIAEIERRYRRDILDFQILYSRTMAEHYPQYRRYARDLAVLTEAARMRELLVRADANEELGERSPWHGDAEADACDQRATYDRYVELKLMILQPVNTRRRSPTRQTRQQEPDLPAVASAKAGAQATRRVRQPARESCNRNDLTRRGEGSEAREEHKQFPLAQLFNTPKMRDFLKRIQTAIAEQKPRRERRGSPPEAATTSTGPARERDTPLTETAPALSAPAAETPSGDEQHVAAESPRPPAFPPGLLFVADCGSTRRSAGRPSAFRAGGPRSTG
jgi:hypothetical protein